MGFIKELKKNYALFIMLIPATIIMLAFSYAPMFGIIVAFKNYTYEGGFFWSKWIGLKNFEFLFGTDNAFIITRNVISYNMVFIILGLVASLFIAIALNEITSKRKAKLYQGVLILPNFISWVVISYLLFAFLSEDKGFVNSVLVHIGQEPFPWYMDPKPWPFLIVLLNIWKTAGFSSILYYNGIMAIDTEYYEAAVIDGASKYQQMKYITLPLVRHLVIITTLLAIGRIFYSDYGLFYQVPRNSGPLIPVTEVIDTYVLRGVTATGDIGMSSAAGLYQSLVGFLLVLLSNFIVKKIDNQYALF